MIVYVIFAFFWVFSFSHHLQHEISTWSVVCRWRFQKILPHISSVFEKTWSPVIPKVWLAKPVKLSKIPVLFLHDCCGMFKSCAINLKVPRSAEILCWNVFLLQKSQHFTSFFMICWQVSVPSSISPCVCLLPKCLKKLIDWKEMYFRNDRFLW